MTATPANDLAGIQLKVQYDSSVVQVPAYGVTQGTLPQGFLFSARADNSQGQVTIIARQKASEIQIEMVN
ncbi:MAG: hypothetical protein IH996_09730, partial [Proteobacteria bacterium]|nr:hypothetical protein [Pseudomonadota bacterium]